MILAVAVYVENYGEENYPKKNILMDKIYTIRNKDPEFLDAIVRLENSEIVF
jgi:hypothetical protein